MRCFLVGALIAALSACASPLTAKENESAAERPASNTAAKDAPPMPSFDLSDWLATPPDPYPKADAALQAWIAERDAILAGEKPPFLDWHEQVRGYQRKSEESADPFVKAIYRRVALDQYGRLDGPVSTEASVALAARLGFDFDEAGIGAFSDRLMRSLVGTDLDNTAFLQRELEARDGRWWTVAEVGADVSGKIWLLTQHADQNPTFQQEALRKMAPLLDTGEIKRNNYAYLWDRVAVATNQPQRFGTQGRCVGPGNWEAFVIETPVEEVNARRSAFDIKMTFEENKARIDAICPG